MPDVRPHNPTPAVMPQGDILHWAQPRNIADLAGQPNLLWLQERGYRTGEAPHYQPVTPVDVTGPIAEFATPGATRKLSALLQFLGGDLGWLIRDWSFPCTYVTGDQSVNVHAVGAAIYGYCHDRVKWSLSDFATKYQYGCLIYTAEPARRPGAPHRWVGGKPHAGIGASRTRDDVAMEWQYCNLDAIGDVQDAHQVTIYDPEPGTGDRMFLDLAGHYGAHYPSGR